ncbi:thioredoxin domain-containing protein [Sorangium sp. So ce1151]|uniref:thioredoxin family protein n=1 Tax=Sorangium sp. So ce1151 TaxID=3133332 RepID=UPI003F5E5F94
MTINTRPSASRTREDLTRAAAQRSGWDQRHAGRNDTRPAVLGSGSTYPCGDDYVDVFGDFEANRRPAGEDVRSGVVSVPIRILLERATADEKAERASAGAIGPRSHGAGAEVDPITSSRGDAAGHFRRGDAAGHFRRGVATANHGECKMPSMNVKVLKQSSDFEAEVLQSPVPVLVSFSATWDGPGKALAPTIDSIADDFQGRLKVVRVDFDECPEVARRYGVKSLPTILAFERGQKTAHSAGLTSREVILGMFNL